MHRLSRADLTDTESGRTILIVDDSAVERTVLAGFLREYYQIATAKGGREAIDMLRNGHEHIAAVVLDIVMPDMDGYEVMQALRGNAAFSHIPIIVSTGLEDDEAREKAIAYGANSFVTKPYNRALLLHAVRNAVRLRDMVTVAEQTKAEQQQKNLLDNLPAGAALYEFDGRNIRAVHINKSYWALVGREPGDYTNLSIFDTIHPDDHEMIYQEIRSAIRQKRNVAIDLRVLGGNGSYKPFHVSANVVSQPNGVYALYAFFRPITEDAMAIQQMLPIALSTMMSSSDDFSYVMDKDFRYICCSKSAAKILGLPSERDIFGKTDAELFGPQLGKAFADNKREVAESGEPLLGQVEEIRKAAGGVLFVSTSIYPISDPAGRVIGLYGISRDVSKERKLTFELDTLLHTIPSGVMKYAADEREQFEYVNRNFVESLGYTQESFKEKFHNSFREMLWHEDREQAEHEVAVQEGGGEIGKFDYRVEAADGTLRWIHDEGIKITDQEGKSWYYVTLFDITEQRAYQEKLRISEEFNRLAMEHSGKIVTQFDVRNKTLSLPESLTPIFQVPHILKNMPEEQIQLGRVAPETADAYRKLFADITAGSKSGTATFQQGSTKGWRWLEAKYTTVFSDSGEAISAVITFEDATEQLEKEMVYNKWQQSLTDRPKESYTLFRCNLSKNSFFDSCEGTLIDISFARDKQDFGELTAGYALRVFEDDRDKYLAFINSDTMLANYYRGKRADSLEYRETKPDGSARWLRLSVELVEYPNSKDVEVYLMYEDINEAKRIELATKEKAETDPLTGVLNRVAFFSRMEQIIRSSKPGESHALLLLDVDDFKRINDTFGHDAGDKALVSLTCQIKARLRRYDLVGRLGGDEFLVLVKCIPDYGIAAVKAKQLCDAQLGIEQINAPITVSIGIAMVPRDGTDCETLYKKADVALYKQKSTGKNGFRVFEAEPS